MKLFFGEISVFTPTLNTNCDFTVTFHNVVVLPLFYENEASTLPENASFVPGCLYWS